MGRDRLAIAGGSFVRAETQLTPYVARWDGEQWRPIGSGKRDSPSGPVDVFAGFRGDLVVAGIRREGETPSEGDRRYICRWDGKEWSTLGLVNGPVRTLYAVGDRLYVGGEFTKVNEVSCRNVVAWYD